MKCHNQTIHNPLQEHEEGFIETWSHHLDLSKCNSGFTSAAFFFQIVLWQNHVHFITIRTNTGFSNTKWKMQKGRVRRTTFLVWIICFCEMRKHVKWWWIILDLHGWSKQFEYFNVFISVINMKDSLGNPTHVTKMVGVKNIGTAVSNNVTLRRKTEKELLKYNTYEIVCLLCSQL